MGLASFHDTRDASVFMAYNTRWLGPGRLEGTDDPQRSGSIIFCPPYSIGHYSPNLGVRSLHCSISDEKEVVPFGLPPAPPLDRGGSGSLADQKVHANVGPS